MSDLIPGCPWVDFKKIVDAGKVEELKSCEILLPEHKFNVVIFHGDAFTKDYARTQSEYLALRTNTVGGKDHQELLEEIEQCQSLNLSVQKDVGDLKSSVGTKKSRKSGVRHVRRKSKGSGRRSVLVSAGATIPTPI